MNCVPMKSKYWVPLVAFGLLLASCQDEEFDNAPRIAAQPTVLRFSVTDLAVIDPAPQSVTLTNPWYGTLQPPSVNFATLPGWLPSPPAATLVGGTNDSYTITFQPFVVGTGLLTVERTTTYTHTVTITSPNASNSVDVLIELTVSKTGSTPDMLLSWDPAAPEYAQPLPTAQGLLIPNTPPGSIHPDIDPAITTFPPTSSAWDSQTDTYVASGDTHTIFIRVLEGAGGTTVGLLRVDDVSSINFPWQVLGDDNLSQPPAWLGLAPAPILDLNLESGNTANLGTGVELTIRSHLVSSGEHIGWFKIKPLTDPPLPTQTVVVYLLVASALTAEIELAPSEINLRTSPIDPIDQEQMFIRNVGGAPLNFTLIPNREWIQLRIDRDKDSDRKYNGIVEVGGLEDNAWVFGVAFQEDAWLSEINSSGAPIARYSHSAVWTGTEMIVWGGRDDLGTVLSDGKKFDPIRGGWASIATKVSGLTVDIIDGGTIAVDAGRSEHTAVWTGVEMIIWGGYTEIFPTETSVNLGERYDFATDTWDSQAISSIGAPSPRAGHSVAWTGDRKNPMWLATEMIIWGGRSGSTYRMDGARYNPRINVWIDANNIDSRRPSPRWQHVGVWAHDRMFIVGGFGRRSGSSVPRYIDDVVHYDPVFNEWRRSFFVLQGDSYQSYPFTSARSAGVWTGQKVSVWGGYDSTKYLDTGAAFDPRENVWVKYDADNPATARGDHTAVWTGQVIFFWGGMTGVAVDLGIGYLPQVDLAPNIYHGLVAAYDPEASNSPEWLAVTLNHESSPIIQTDPEIIEIITLNRDGNGNSYQLRYNQLDSQLGQLRVSIMDANTALNPIPLNWWAERENMAYQWLRFDPVDDRPAGVSGESFDLAIDTGIIPPNSSDLPTVLSSVATVYSPEAINNFDRDATPPRGSVNLPVNLFLVEGPQPLMVLTEYELNFELFEDDFDTAAVGEVVFVRGFVYIFDPIFLTSNYEAIIGPQEGDMIVINDGISAPVVFIFTGDPTTVGLGVPVQIVADAQITMQNFVAAINAEVNRRALDSSLSNLHVMALNDSGFDPKVLIFHDFPGPMGDNLLTGGGTYITLEVTSGFLASASRRVGIMNIGLDAGVVAGGVPQGQPQMDWTANKPNNSDAIWLRVPPKLYLDGGSTNNMLRNAQWFRQTDGFWNGQPGHFTDDTTSGVPLADWAFFVASYSQIMSQIEVIPPLPIPPITSTTALPGQLPDSFRMRTMEGGTGGFSLPLAPPDNISWFDINVDRSRKPAFTYTENVVVNATWANSPRAVGTITFLDALNPNDGDTITISDGITVNPTTGLTEFTFEFYQGISRPPRFSDPTDPSSHNVPVQIQPPPPADSATPTSPPDPEETLKKLRFHIVGTFTTPPNAPTLRVSSPFTTRDGELRIILTHEVSPAQPAHEVPITTAPETNNILVQGMSYLAAPVLNSPQKIKVTLDVRSRPIINPSILEVTFLMEWCSTIVSAAQVITIRDVNDGLNPEPLEWFVAEEDEAWQNRWQSSCRWGRWGWGGWFGSGAPGFGGGPGTQQNQDDIDDWLDIAGPGSILNPGRDGDAIVLSVRASALSDCCSTDGRGGSWFWGDTRTIEIRDADALNGPIPIRVTLQQVPPGTIIPMQFGF